MNGQPFVFVTERRLVLLTRHVKDYMLLMLAVDHPGEHIVRLDA